MLRATSPPTVPSAVKSASAACMCASKFETTWAASSRWRAAAQATPATTWSSWPDCDSPGDRGRDHILAPTSTARSSHPVLLSLVPAAAGTPTTQGERLDYHHDH